MTKPQPDPDVTGIVRLLDVNEIDQVAVERIERIDGYRDALLAVARGKVTASPYQRKTAIFLLGMFRVPEAAAPLMGLLDTDRATLGLPALAALRRIGPDATIAEALVRLARDDEATAAEVAYALRAVAEATDRSVIDAARQAPPAHRDDAGVLEAWQQLRDAPGVTPPGADPRSEIHTGERSMPTMLRPSVPRRS